jgi:hypothetical protein
MSCSAWQGADALDERLGLALGQWRRGLGSGGEGRNGESGGDQGCGEYSEHDVFILADARSSCKRR